MGNYHVPVKYLFSKVLDCEIVSAPPITNNTVELGAKYSPDFVCMPFKYTLGTFIECLDKGANVLMQAGGGCRYGYYSELQEQILSDLGYEFEFINFVTAGKTDIKKIIKELKKINPKLNILKLGYYGLITKQMVKYMDNIDHYIRANIGFEEIQGSFNNLLNKMLKKFSHTKGFFDLRRTYKKYLKEFKKLPINKPNNCLKIGIIGELYTIMEPFANYYLEKLLASYNIEIKRFTNVHYLLFEKGKKSKKYIEYASKYIKYKMGADAADNIGRAKYLCENGYDGIIHIKSSFCTPEIGAMPIINKICNEYNVPVIFFSFDSNTSEVGIKTRIEAFYDMIEMRKDNERMLPRD